MVLNNHFQKYFTYIGCLILFMEKMRISRKPLNILYDSDKLSSQWKSNTCFVKKDLKLMNCSAVILIVINAIGNLYACHISYTSPWQKLNSNGQQHEQLLGVILEMQNRKKTSKMNVNVNLHPGWHSSELPFIMRTPPAK